MRPWLLAAALLGSGGAWAEAPVPPESRRDHRGSVGLRASFSTAFSDAVGNQASGMQGVRWGPELGLSLALGDAGNELAVSARLLRFRAGWEGTAGLGYWSYFGRDAWKSYFLAELQAWFPNVPTVGPRLQVGVQWDFSSLVGCFTGVGGHLGFGAGVRYAAEWTLGCQLRSYWFQ